MSDACVTAALLAAVTQRQRIPWPEHISSAAMLSAVDYHGVSALLHERLDLLSDWPEEVRAALIDDARARAMWELRHAMLLREIIGALGMAGVEPVFIKGTALAYGYYAEPHLRTRADTDIVIPPEQRPLVHKQLERLGFKVDRSEAGRFASSQATFTLSTPGFGNHCIDLHWAINNSALIARSISVHELRRAATSLSALSESALSASPIHALLLACLHRVAHQSAPYYSNGRAILGGDRLIWLFDIHLLASSLTEPQWQAMIALARERGAQAVLSEGLDATRSHFNTAYPEQALRETVPDRSHRRLTRYMRSGSLQRGWLDFTTIDRTRDRLGWLREVLLPPKAYMLAKYSGTRFDWLPWLYLRRALAGLARHLIRSHVG